MKPALVFLPGMMCDEGLFTPQIDRFSNSHDVFVGRLTGSDTIGGIARGVLSGVPSANFSLVGLSMGGIVAMEMMRQAESRIDRVALLDTNHLADPPERREIRRCQMADVRAGKLRQIVMEEMKPNYLAKTNRENSNLLDLLIDMAMGLGPKVFLSQSLALMARREGTDLLKSWNKPALFACGEEGVLCPPERHREMASLTKGSEFHVIKEAGHITTLEAPERVNDLIAVFLAT